MIAQPLSGYYAPAFDDADEAIVGEAATARLALHSKRQITRGESGRTARNAWAFLSGHHGIERMRMYEVAAHDGLEWTYYQPYSGLAQLPGEHHFVLRGSLPAAVEVLPPAIQWRTPRFVFAVMGMCALLTLFYGVGLLLLGLLVLVFPPTYRFKSADPKLARWLSKQPAIRAVLRKTRFGWLRVLGTGGWKLPWVMQLHSVGNGYSRLVCVAPDVGRVSFTRFRVGFAQAASLARAMHASLGQWAYPPQSPRQPPLCAE